MRTTISRRYAFEAAHFLPLVPATHKCHRVHGHNYEIDVKVECVSGLVNGFVIDFWDLDKVVDPLVEMLDHRTLNDIKGLENPTAELIAAWFIQRINNGFDGATLQCTAVTVHETKNCFACVEYV